MAKRFTETEKWKDPWFRKLEPRLKLLWFWMCDQCDAAGVIDPDMELAAFQLGVTVKEPDFLKFEGRVERLENGKWFLKKFIPFQYGELSEDCRAHGPVFRSLEINRVSKGYPKGMDTLQDKDKDKDKDKDRTKTRTVGGVGDAQKPLPGKVDDQWLSELASNPAFSGIDIPLELARAQAWTAQRNRQCTRRFFTNWLLRVERPVTANGAALPLSKRY